MILCFLPEQNNFLKNDNITESFKFLQSNKLPQKAQKLFCLEITQCTLKYLILKSSIFNRLLTSPTIRTHPPLLACLYTSQKAHGYLWGIYKSIYRCTLANLAIYTLFQKLLTCNPTNIYMYL